MKNASTFHPFNTMIQNCGLLKFPCLENIFSWRGRRNSKTIWCRLDRTLPNEDWHAIFTHSFVEYLTMIGSDHRPILATIENKIPRGMGHFWFDKRWIGQEELMESIATGWGDTRGWEDGNIVEKIIGYRQEISRWRKENLPYGKEKISKLQKAVEDCQNDDNRTSEELFDLTQILKEAYKDEEEYLQQKSRTTWVKVGDTNSKFLHAQTKQR